MYIILEVTNIKKVEVNDLHFDILLQGGQYDLHFDILQYQLGYYLGIFLPGIRYNLVAARYLQGM